MDNTPIHILGFLSGFLSLLGATPIEGGSEVRNYGLHTVWTIAGVLPPVNKSLSEQAGEKLLERYTQLCQFSNVIDVTPYKVTIYRYAKESHIYVSVYD